MESYIDVKYSKGITGKVKGLFNKSDCDDVIDQVFSCNRSLNSYLGDTGVDWQVRTTKKGVVIHPIIGPNTKGSISEGDTCECDTSGDDDHIEMTSDLPQSTGVWKHWRLGGDGNQSQLYPEIHECVVTGDRGYKVVVNICYTIDRDIIKSIQVTSPYSVESSMKISDGMKCWGGYTAAIRNSLLLLYTGRILYLYDIRSGKRLWSVYCGYIPDVLEWRCDKHAKFVCDGGTFTINMW